MTKEECGVIHAPYIPCFQNQPDKSYNYLYVSDDLVSNRIDFTGKRVVVSYYKSLSELNIPWYKFWINKYAILNDRNMDLFKEAMAVANIKCLPPVFPPNRILPY